MELSPQQDVYYIDTVSPIDYFIDTVTPSAIQLNKEKTMSIELDGPLYLGSNSLQQQVDQNTEDITELQSDVSSIEGDIGSLDNLATSDKSSLVNAINETLSVLDPTQTADYIKNSKGLESGEISTNASILPWVEEMSHSTYVGDQSSDASPLDPKKFTYPAGHRPNITDNGIASNFSGNNVIQSPNLASYLKNCKEFTIKARAKATVNPTTDSRNQNIAILAPDRYTYWSGMLFTDDLGYFIHNANCLMTDKYHDVSLTYNFDTNTTTWYFDGEYVTNSTSYNYAESIEAATSIYLILGYIGSYALWKYYGDIDLKYISVECDGVEVFNGNKTGIDTVKPVDFTAITSSASSPFVNPSLPFSDNELTISADGIASGFSENNYLSTFLDLSSAKSWQFYMEFTPYTLGSSTQYLFSYASRNLFKANIETNGKIWWSVHSQADPDASHRIFSFTTSSTVNLNTLNTLIFEYDETVGYSITLNGTKTPSSSTTTKIGSPSGLAFLLGSNASAFLNGSIDLNALKIYTDGNLVYQPCLKIPYTKSKTGSKIVNAIYRDRVADMYEQFGYAPYYTLDTTNSNYTIPKGEVYGMVNKLVPTLVAPDYSKPVSLTYSSGLAMKNNGWLEVQIQSSEATANPYVSINGSIICRTSVNSNGDLNRDTAMMVVRKGDIITSGGYSADTAIVLTYYPFKV